MKNEVCQTCGLPKKLCICNTLKVNLKGEKIKREMKGYLALLSHAIGEVLLRVDDVGDDTLRLEFEDKIILIKVRNLDW